MADAADTLGERLTGLRKAAEKSQDEVARAVDCNSGTYSRWERDVAKPRADEIVKLAQHFGCTTDYLLLGGVLSEREMPRALHAFLATKWGRYAHKKNLVDMLRGIRVMPDGHPPSVKSYTRIVRTFAMFEDEGFDDELGDDPPKTAH